MKRRNVPTPPRAVRGAVARAALAAALVTAGGCASLAPPERPVYEGADNVGEVAPDRLVGVWDVTPLNPYPEQRSQTTVIEYRPDGSVLGRVEPDGEEAAALGDIAFEMSGRWTLADGIVRHEDVRMEPVSDNAFAKLMSGVVNGAKRDLGGTADIYELEADRIVMLGDDGAAMEYVRR